MSNDQIAFMRINQKIKDLYNRVAVGSAASFIFNGRVNDPTAFKNLENTLTSVGKKTYGLFTSFMTMIHLLTKNNSYLVSQMAVYTGNNLAFYLEMQFQEFITMAANSSTQKAWEEKNYIDNRAHYIQFTVGGSKDMKQTALTNAQLKVMSFDGKDYIYSGVKASMNVLNRSDEEKMYSNFMIYLPNYHSYIVRYPDYFQMCSLSLFKLYNPFAGFENQYSMYRPECTKWACLLTFKTIEGESYIVLYDTKFEWMRDLAEPNFREIFGKHFNLSDPMDCFREKKNISFNLADIPAKYTIYPLQVLRVENLQLVAFDKAYRNQLDDDELAASLFYSNKTKAQLTVNRHLKVTMTNLYVSSDYIDAKVSELYGVTLHLKLAILPFYEYDYVKYYLFMLACLLAAAVHKFCAYRALKKQEAQRITEVEDEVTKQHIDTARRKTTRKKTDLHLHDQTVELPEDAQHESDTTQTNFKADDEESRT